MQLDGKGYTFVEVLAQCPTNWNTSMKESLEFINKLSTRIPSVLTT